jgi:hypothetical protein
MERVASEQIRNRAKIGIIFVAKGDGIDRNIGLTKAPAYLIWLVGRGLGIFAVADALKQTGKRVSRCPKHKRI